MKNLANADTTLTKRPKLISDQLWEKVTSRVLMGHTKRDTTSFSLNMLMRKTQTKQAEDQSTE